MDYRRAIIYSFDYLQAKHSAMRWFLFEKCHLVDVRIVNDASSLLLAIEHDDVIVITALSRSGEDGYPCVQSPIYSQDPLIK